MYQSRPGDEAAPSPEQIGRFQERVLEAVLSGGTLPGASEPVSFPDLQFLTREPAVLVLDENFQGAPPAGSSVRVVSRHDLEREAGRRGEVAYLHFQPPAVRGGEVRFTLEAKVASADPARRPMGLAGMQFVMREDEGGEWRGSQAAALAF